MNFIQHVWCRPTPGNSSATWVMVIGVVLSLMSIPDFVTGTPQTGTEHSGLQEIAEPQPTGSENPPPRTDEKAVDGEEDRAQLGADALFGTDPDYVIGRFVIPAVIFLIAVLTLSLAVIFHDDSAKHEVENFQNVGRRWESKRS